MRFAAVLCLLGLSVEAFVIPPGTPDGLYSVKRNADGVDEHTNLVRDANGVLTAGTMKFTSRDDVAPVNTTSFEERDDSFIYCGCGLAMNHGYCDGAVNDIKRKIGSGTVTINAYSNIYGISGGSNGVVAFICNGDPSSHQTNAGIFTNVIQSITSACGSYVPGARYNTFDKLVHGYQIGDQRVTYCDNWAKGRKGSC